jgi:hypothetical protein
LLPFGPEPSVFSVAVEKLKNYNIQDSNFEYRLRVFENRVLRRILGPKRDEVTGDWRKLPNEELHDLYSSPSIISTNEGVEESVLVVGGKARGKEATRKTKT